MPDMQATISGFNKTLAVPPYSAVIGRDGLLYYDTVYNVKCNTSSTTIISGQLGKKINLCYVFITGTGLTLTALTLKDTNNKILATWSGIPTPMPDAGPLGFAQTDSGYGVKLELAGITITPGIYITVRYLVVPAS